MTCDTDGVYGTLTSEMIRSPDDIKEDTEKEELTWFRYSVYWQNSTCVIKISFNAFLSSGFKFTAEYHGFQCRFTMLALRLLADSRGMFLRPASTLETR